MILEDAVEKCLPDAVIKIIRNYKNINEIRMRENSKLALTVGNKNIICNYVTSKKDIEYSFTHFCKCSVYSYSDNIKQGFIPFDGGYRIGVCGKAVLDKKEIINISDIKSLNIRIPSGEINISTDFLENIPYQKSILIYSAPNTGKTTLLKNIASFLSSPPQNKRVVVIDCKNEIYSENLHEGRSIDFFTNYPKAIAIDLAVRNMTPQFIICDEIGLNEEIDSLIECKNSGVGLICSAHASSIEELFKRSNIKHLQKAGVFGGYIGIKQTNNTRQYSFIRQEEIKC